MYTRFPSTRIGRPVTSVAGFLFCEILYTLGGILKIRFK
jgi:hypothetical protein